MADKDLIQAIVKHHRVQVQQILIAEGVIANSVALITKLGLGKKLALVVDAQTYNAAGKALEQYLSTAFLLKTIILPEPVQADLATVNLLINNIGLCDLIIAVGSGTINDLCKYSSFLSKIAYLVFPTALSMNGYVSATASIADDGIKQSLPATLPIAVFIDMEVIAASPKRLTASGIGDLLCRPSAQADWKLSNLLTGTNYNQQPFDWLAPYEQLLYSNNISLVQLAEMNILSGLGMYISGGSYPASGGEHIIAHLMDSCDQGNHLHGEQIAVTTLTMLRLQQLMLSTKPYLSKDFITGSKYPNSNLAKISQAEIDHLNQNIATHWTDIMQEISNSIINPDILQKIAANAGLATNYHQMGWKRADYLQAILGGAFARNRFGFLDLANLSGDLERFIDII